MLFAWFYCPHRMVRATYPTKIGITVAHPHDKNNNKKRATFTCHAPVFVILTF
ncbi:hypothetical protein SAMN02745202_00357 [Segatella oulorum]|uniref:Uncharacterized protein n=1 Tax=Segatella oulorum TaxID=28136 RepID=A0A1T4LAI9_9BACT|nr:hypothetical protein SAMN02745202_00357 [Segatella oulorum]